MTVIFRIEGDLDWHTTDPEVVPCSRHIVEGDYVQLPDGRVFFLKKDYPPEFVEVSLDQIPSGVSLLQAQKYNQ